MLQCQNIVLQLMTALNVSSFQDINLHSKGKIELYNVSIKIKGVFVCFDPYLPVSNFSVMLGGVFLG